MPKCSNLLSNSLSNAKMALFIRKLSFWITATKLVILSWLTLEVRPTLRTLGCQSLPSFSSQENSTVVSPPSTGITHLCPSLITAGGTQRIFPLKLPWAVHTQTQKFPVIHSWVPLWFAGPQSTLNLQRWIFKAFPNWPRPCECSSQFIHLFPDVLFCGFPDWLTGYVHRTLRLGLFSDAIHWLERKQEHTITHPQSWRGP